MQRASGLPLCAVDGRYLRGIRWTPRDSQRAVTRSQTGSTAAHRSDEALRALR